MDTELPTPRFDAVVDTAAGGAVVRVRGEVDLASVPALWEVLSLAETRLHGAFADGPLVLDLRAVTFLDASGLGVLVRAARRARRRGGRVVLRHPSPIALRVLELSRALPVFETGPVDGCALAPRTPGDVPAEIAAHRLADDLALIRSWS